MKNLRQIGLLLLPFLLLVGFIVSTDPYKIPLVLLVVPFALLGIGVFRLSTFLLLEITRFSRARARLFAGLITSFVIIAMILQSIRQLSLVDFALLVVLLMGLSFYLRRI